MPYICKNIPKEKLSEILKEFNSLAREINRVGEIRKLHFELSLKDEELKKTKADLMTIKGSRLVKAALMIRDFLKK
jgi:predicted transcriptional regulator